MWLKFYQDYEEDTPLIKEGVEPGKGIIGCEMHERNGWGLTQHVYKRPKPWLVRVYEAIFKRKK